MKLTSFVKRSARVRWQVVTPPLMGRVFSQRRGESVYVFLPTRAMTRLCMAATVLVLAACADDGNEGPPERRVDDVTLVVSTESEILSRPVDIALDDRGNLYVLDYLLAQILVLSPSGERLRTIGREGRGPREFIRPRAFNLSRDTVRVVDIGNGRLQTLALDTDFMRTTPLPPGSGMGEVAVNDNGWLLASTLGRLDALASYHDASGNQVGVLGSPPASAATMMNFASMKKEIVAGIVPAMMRNSVLPLFATDGSMWLILTGEGLVQRYDNDGSLQVSVPLVAPEMERIWADVVERNRAEIDDQRGVHGLVYVADAMVVGQTLWVLLNMPKEEPAVMLALASDGTVEQRVVFSGVIGATQFAFDRSRDRILFTIQSNASIVAASWPDEVF